MPRPNPLTPEVRAAFLDSLRGGTLVVAAAASVGVAVSTLYWRRKRDPAFDAEWTAAAEASLGFVWRTRKGRRRRGRGRGRRRARRVLVATKRRIRFGARRRGLYLDSLEHGCDTRYSARRAGVWPSTVYRALKRDPGFALRNGRALELGFERLERRAALERARSADRMIAIVERIGAATARPASREDRNIRRLKRRWRPDRPGGGRGPGFERAPAEAMGELRRKIRRIELAGWKRARGRGLAPLAGGAARAADA